MFTFLTILASLIGAVVVFFSGAKLGIWLSAQALKRPDMENKVLHQLKRHGAPVMWWTMAASEAKWRQALRESVEDVHWCGGAKDFQPGQSAHKGWEIVRMRAQAHESMLKDGVQ